MTNKTENGGYVPDGAAGILQVDYIEELLQNAVLAMKCSRGSFYPDKNYGSLLKNSIKAPAEQYVLAFARQAVECLDGVYVKSAQMNNNIAVLTVLLNNEERQVSLEV